MCHPKRRIPRSLYAVDRQTPQLYERKAGHNEARNDLNLGIAQSPQRRGLGRTPRRCDNNDGNEQNAPVRPSCAALQTPYSVAKKQMTAGLLVRVLCDADAIGLHRRWPAEASYRARGGHSRNVGKLRRASISLCAIQSGLNTIQEVALIERLGQIADDPSLKCAGTNIIARIGSYHYGGNLFAQSRQIVVQIKATHLGHVEVDNQAAGASQFG